MVNMLCYVNLEGRPCIANARELETPDGLRYVEDQIRGHALEDIMKLLELGPREEQIED